jgi:hypothetical protein
VSINAPSVPQYPANLDLAHRAKIARWRPLVHWLLAIPHLIVVAILSQIGSLIWIVCFFTVLFTRNIPEGLFNFQAMILRYSARTLSYVLYLREEYPPFDFTMSADDPGGDPIVVSVDRPEQLNRWLPLVKWLLIIPHLIVIYILFLVAYVVAIIGFFAVIILGRWPEGMHNFIVGVGRWGHRINAYIYLLRDEYPPFTLNR